MQKTGRESMRRKTFFALSFLISLCLCNSVAKGFFNMLRLEFEYSYFQQALRTHFTHQFPGSITPCMFSKRLQHK